MPHRERLRQLLSLRSPLKVVQYRGKTNFQEAKRVFNITESAIPHRTYDTNVPGGRGWY
jgi:pyruvate-formate lyase